jgi:anthranilate phosphoribosyltransferase
MTPPACFADALADLLERRDLDTGRMSALMREILSDRLGEPEVAALLIALRMKGETAEELAAAAGVVRELMIPLDTGRDDVLDTCGTGGDGCCTFNVSTATALVAAAAGVPVVKHGNRAVSSQTGSADVLAALGVDVGHDSAACRSALERAGMAFCLAPSFHPALRHLGALRRRLGVRTILNALGPLANPARAPYQLLGVGRPEWLDRMAEALVRHGTRHAFLVRGRDGLDEVTLTSATMVREVHGRKITVHEWTAPDFGLEMCSLDDLRVSSPEQSAAMIRSVLAGAEGPALRMVLANAAAALLAAERVTSLKEGVARARDAVHSGRAAQVLERLRTG